MVTKQIVVRGEKGAILRVGVFKLSPTSLEATAEITEGDWIQCGEFLSRAEGSIHWWIGDWVLLWREEWGDKRKDDKRPGRMLAYEAAAEITGFARVTVQHDAGTALTFGKCRRRHILKFNHHLEVVPLPEPEQEYWLSWCCEEEPPRSVAKLRQAIRAEAKRKALEDSEFCDHGHVMHGDALVFLAGLPDHEADLLLTDPPYMTDVPDIRTFAASWLPLALSKIRTTGRAYIFTGAYPDEIHAYLEVLSQQSNGMKLENLLVWTYRNTLGPAPSDSYKLNWQACFYLKGPDAPPLNCPEMIEQFTVQDVPAPDGRFPDGRFHAWEKPEEIAERFIRHATEPGAKIIDPFAGTGTFILASMRLGRKAIGCELSEEMIGICKTRGLKIHAL